MSTNTSEAAKAATKTKHEACTACGFKFPKPQSRATCQSEAACKRRQSGGDGPKGGGAPAPAEKAKGAAKKAASATKAAAPKKEAAPKAAAAPKPAQLTASEKRERANAAKEEHKALQEWEHGGQKGERPSTLNLDAMKAEYDEKQATRPRVTPISDARRAKAS